MEGGRSPLATSSTALEPVGLAITRTESASVYTVKGIHSLGATVKR